MARPDTADERDFATATATPALPDTAELLVQGGDTRIALQAGRRTNRYGCPPAPAPEVLAFGSATASIISQPAFEAAEALRQGLSARERTTPRALSYAQALERVRRELLELCGLSHVQGLDVLFGSSGTALHGIAAALAGDSNKRGTLVIVVDPSETGSSVGDALAGAAPVGGKLEIASLPLRLPDGTPRPTEALDAAIRSRVTRAVGQGRRVLLTMVDVSRSGLIAPSAACVASLRRCFPLSLDVLVDACQFRMAPATLEAYLRLGCMVAVTGSKFVTGPACSGALLIPPTMAERFRRLPLPRALDGCSLRAEWPRGWAARESLDDAPNYGLLLRWEAALAELRRFRAVPETETAAFLKDFSWYVAQRLREDPHFEALPVPAIDRHPLVQTGGWDHIQTIFPFVPCAPDGTALSTEDTARLYEELRDGGCHLGQPIACGQREGRRLSALSLCASARLVVEGTEHGGEHRRTVIDRALSALDQVARNRTAAPQCVSTRPRAHSGADDRAARGDSAGPASTQTRQPQAPPEQP